MALLAGLFLFLPGVKVLEWKESVQKVSWDSILLICSGILLGELLYQYGIAEWMARLLFWEPLLQTGLFFTGFYIVLTVSVLKILFSSNTVAGVILVPVMVTLAQRLGQGSGAGCALRFLLRPFLYSNYLQPRECHPIRRRLLYAGGDGPPRHRDDADRRSVIGFWLTVLQVR